MKSQTLTLITLAALLTACQSTTIEHRSAITLPAAYDHAAPARADNTDIRRWWQAWHDPVLNQLITEALTNNPDIAIARSRLKEAQATANLADADRGATIGAGINAGHLDADLDNPLGGTPLAHSDKINTHKTVLATNLSAKWEADLFGQKQSDADAARYAALASAEQTHAAQLQISAAVADAYLQARAIEARQQLADANIATLEKLAHYVDARYRAGHTTAYEKTEAQSHLTAARAARSTLEAERAVQIRKIAVLLGKTPQGYQLPASSADILAHPPAAPSGQTPQGLIERRPDLRARAAEINARAAKVASAKADLYPRLTLNFLGQGMLNIDSHDTQKGLFDLLGASLQVPLFTNGRVQANIDAADARLKTALLQYDQTLLQALADVDNAYQASDALATQTRLLAQARIEAEKQATDAEKLYRYGNKTLADTLSARISANQNADNHLRSQLAHDQTLIALYKALGGGWAEK
ncbi:efflux transporter outer membrane subunit [Cardiobacterium hominis]|uniref:efflux transporter outer membrane subunit n=1 Tax=Cardiobacterium hominis TaxID=2718 RepID=UPI0028ED6D4A|nr:efflux transporter outer membrane subunit [Cardiobacterium hominis]